MIRIIRIIKLNIVVDILMFSSLWNNDNDWSWKPKIKYTYIYIHVHCIIILKCTNWFSQVSYWVMLMFSNIDLSVDYVLWSDLRLGHVLVNPWTFAWCWQLHYNLIEVSFYSYILILLIPSPHVTSVRFTSSKYLQYIWSHRRSFISHVSFDWSSSSRCVSHVFLNNVHFDLLISVMIY